MTDSNPSATPSLGETRVSSITMPSFTPHSTLDIPDGVSNTGEILPTRSQGHQESDAQSREDAVTGVVAYALAGGGFFAVMLLCGLFLYRHWKYQSIPRSRQSRRKFRTAKSSGNSEQLFPSHTRPPQRQNSTGYKARNEMMEAEVEDGRSSDSDRLAMEEGITMDNLQVPDAVVRR